MAMGGKMNQALSVQLKFAIQFPSIFSKETSPNSNSSHPSTYDYDRQE